MANELTLWVLLKLIPILMGNPYIDWVWVCVWRIPDFFNWECGYTYSLCPRPYTHHNTLRFYRGGFTRENKQQWEL